MHCCNLWAANAHKPLAAHKSDTFFTTNCNTAFNEEIFLWQPMSISPLVAYCCFTDYHTLVQFFCYAIARVLAPINKKKRLISLHIKLSPIVYHPPYVNFTSTNSFTPINSILWVIILTPIKCPYAEQFRYISTITDFLTSVNSVLLLMDLSIITLTNSGVQYV